LHILVIGGAGYIGSHVTLDLMNEGHEVTVFDDLSTGRQCNLFADAHFVRGDILAERDLPDLLAVSRFDAAIHLAALKAAGDSMQDPETYADHNVRGSIAVLNAVSRARIPYFIFSSTAALFGEPAYLPIDEQHPLDPANFYGFTKLEIERHLAWYARLCGLGYVSLRYFNAAGYDPELRVKGLETEAKNLIPIVMEVAVGKRDRLQVYGSDYETRDGTCIRDYVHVLDLARAHTAALDYLGGGGASTVVNLGSERGHTVLEVIETARAVTGHPIPYDLVDRRPGDSPCLYASSGRARDLLGWQPRFSDLRTMVETTWKAYMR